MMEDVHNKQLEEVEDHYIALMSMVIRNCPKINFNQQPLTLPRPVLRW
jgi:hypothetical protein